MATAKKTRHNLTPKKGRAKPWKDVFLAKYSQTANVSLACKAAKISRQYAYEARQADTEFARRWRHAKADAVDQLEAEAWRRAFKGTKKPVFQRGRRVGEVQEYSDTLMIFLLKANRPKKYRENVKHEHSGPNGGTIPVSVTDMETVRAKRWANAGAALATASVEPAGGGDE